MSSDVSGIPPAVGEMPDQNRYFKVEALAPFIHRN